ncbi:MAG: DHH family phosphoesterase [Candidatus Electrothrix sp. YB6]
MSKTAAGQAIQKTHHFVLATHVRPDGDALGSMFGLADILTMMGREVVCYLEQPVPPRYSFLTPQIRIETDFDQIRAFAAQCSNDIMGISLDCGDLSRLGEMGTALTAVRPFLVIDHHQGKGFGELQWVEPHRSSTGEMVYDLAEELGVADRISKEAAECLYMAIVTDTGSFQYDATSAHTFAVAGKLIERGVVPAFICRSLFDNNSFSGLQLMQTVLATLQTYAEDQVAVIRLSRQMLQETGAAYEECEGLIDFPRSVGTVRVAVFLKEADTEKDQVSVSLRAKGDCNVAEVAARFSGGGHRNAAGFRVQGKSLDEVCVMLIPVLEQALKQSAEDRA